MKLDGVAKQLLTVNNVSIILPSSFFLTTIILFWGCSKEDKLLPSISGVTLLLLFLLLCSFNLSVTIVNLQPMINNI
jgi:hypothetical protein